MWESVSWVFPIYTFIKYTIPIFYPYIYIKWLTTWVSLVNQNWLAYFCLSLLKTLSSLVETNDFCIVPLEACFKRNPCFYAVTKPNINSKNAIYLVAEIYQLVFIKPELMVWTLTSFYNKGTKGEYI